MAAAFFYHLTRTPADTLVPALIDRARANGWTVALRAADEGLLSRLDEALWKREGFLPHGRAGGPHDARQPVLLAREGEALGNAPSCLIALAGTGVTAEECAALERACIVFDGADPVALNAARDQWRLLTGAGMAAEYWNDSDGGWNRKMAVPARTG